MYRVDTRSGRPAMLVWNFYRPRCGAHTCSGENAALTILAQSMTSDPVTISPDSRAIDALRLMSNGGFRHLPVVDDGKIWGVVSRGDFKGMELDQLDEENHLWECIR